MIRLRLSLCQKQGLRQDKRRMAFVVADFSIHCKIFHEGKEFET